MKKYLIVFIFFFCLNCLGQEYKFDVFLEYQEQNDKRIRFFLFNAQNINYYFNGGSFYHGLSGKLFDLNKLLLHGYGLENLPPNELNFIYDGTVKIQHFKTNNSNYYFEKSSTLIDSLDKKIEIIVYKNIKKKRIIMKIDLILENSNFNNKNLILYFTHGIFLGADFTTELGIPKQVKVEFMNGNKYTYILTKKKTDFYLELIIPKQNE